MKTFATPIFAFLLVLGMSSTATAIDDGTYDFYGTFNLDARYADGGDHGCASETNDQPCPTTADFCITNLIAVSDALSSGEGASTNYGIAVAEMPGKLIDINYEGIAPVSLTVNDTSNADTDFSMTTSEVEAGCGTAPCVQSLSYGRVAPAGSTGTVTGIIPVGEPDEDPDYYLDCGTGETEAYPDPILTTEDVDSNIDGDTRTESGAKLTAVGPNEYTLKLARGTGILKQSFAGGLITLPYNLFGNTWWEGSLCKRTSASQTCIPVDCP